MMSVRNLSFYLFFIISTITRHVYGQNCGFPEECNGNPLDIQFFATETECLNRCFSIPNCDYYSYCSDTLKCTSFPNCIGFTGASNCVSNERLCVRNTYTKLMAVGGPTPNGISKDVEVVDLSGSHRNCSKPHDYPVLVWGATGEYFDGYPTVCGSTQLCFKYDYKADNWTSHLYTSKLRLYLAGTLLGQDEWWISGGTSGSEASLSRTTTEMLYEGTSQFVNYNDLPEAMEDHTMVRVNATSVIFVGNNPQSDRVYMFDKGSQTYTSLPSLNTVRAYPFAGLSKDSTGDLTLVVSGGHKDLFGLLSTDILDLATMTMNTGPLLPEYKWDGVSVPYRDTFLAVGGWNGSDQVDSILEWSPDSKAWIKRSERMTTARSDFAAFFIPDEITSCS